MQDTITNTTGSVVWLGDTHVVYTTVDETKRSDKVSTNNKNTTPPPLLALLHSLTHTLSVLQVWLHKVGGETPDVLLYHEPNPEFEVYKALSRTKRFLYIASTGAITSEVLMAPAAVPDEGTLALTSVMGRENVRPFLVLPPRPLSQPLSRPLFCTLK